MSNLKNKIVVITGGSKGFGKSLAKTFIDGSATVIITAKSEKNLVRTGQELGIQYFVMDVTKEEQVKQVAQKIIKSFGRVDIWINNAGTWIPDAPIEAMDMKRVHDMVEVNLFGTMYGSKIVLQHMKNWGGGMIVNILSTSALTGRAHSSGYCASKYAARGFTDSLRLEAKADNIKVISVYPGGMKTNLFDEAKSDDYDVYMNPDMVAQKVVSNLISDNPEKEQIIRRKP